MWRVFQDTVPLTATPQFQALCRKYIHLLTPAAQLVAQASAQPPTPLGPMPTTDELMAAVNAVFDSHDVICTPTMATVAPPARDDWASPYGDVYMGTNFTFIANSTGCAAASIPCGTVDGLPVGLQIIGRPGDEPTVLRVCRALEARQSFTHPDLTKLGVS
jgi:Asp-tRNA(Asn)/Glu-tRNA(Gln) amidotransferase A subunit family amidase